MSDHPHLPLMDAELAIPPAIAFVEGALRRIDRVLSELESMDCDDCPRCAGPVGEELRSLSAEAHFFGLVRTHRMIRKARALLQIDACGARVGGSLPPQLGAACLVVIQLRAEMRLELSEMIEGRLG